MRKLLAVAVLAMAFLGIDGLAAEKYVVGVDAAFPPWTWVERGEYKGFDVEVMTRIAALLGFEIEIRDMPWETIVTALAQGKIDILMSGLSITCERMKVIDYSEPYWSVDQAILVREDSALNAITAMIGGRTVGAQSGTTGYMWLEDNLVAQGIGIKVRAYPTYEEAILDLERGRLDSVLCDTDTAQSYIDAGRRVKIVGIVKTGEQYAYAVTKGDPYRLLPKINAGLVQLYESGEWAELVQKYFPGRPVEKIPLKLSLVCR